MRISNVLWGLVFIFVGVVLGLNALEITNINLFFDGWWTLFIIVPCFIDLFKDDDLTGDIVGLVIGFCLFFACNDLINFELILKLMLPAILVAIGISFIFKDTINKSVRKEIKKLNKNNEDIYCSTFGVQNINYDNKEFNGCDLTAVFGGIKCDLSNSLIKGDNVINVSAIFGGVTIYIPEGVKVKTTVMPIFGGLSDEKRNKKDGKNIIYINAICLFGGVDIK